MLRAKKFSYLVAILFCLAILTSLGTAPVMAVTQPADIAGLWAQGPITKMVERGVIAGYPDGTFRPDNDITRAEFITMINEALGFDLTAVINYPDVIGGDWFYSQISRAQAAGYIVGNSDGTMQPNQAITRQEVAIIISKILKLNIEGSTALARFSDAAAVPAWSSPSLSALVREGFMSGYPDGTIGATSLTTRAMAAVIINNVLEKNAVVYDLAGTYGPATGTTTIDGDVAINVPGVILQNTVITGNLTIGAGVAQGEVTLINVTVNGTTFVNGGGENSVNLDGCDLNNVVVNYTAVHISCVNGTTVVSVTLESGATIDVAAGSSIAGITISTTGEVFLSGNFPLVTVDSPNAQITLLDGTITSLIVETGAGGTTLDISKGASIGTLTLDAETDIVGIGTIGTAIVNVSGVTSTIEPGTTNGSGSLEIVTGGGGGGGGAAITVSAITVALLDEGPLTVSGNQVSFDLTAYDDSEAVSQIEIATTPAAAIEDATLEITAINARNIDFLLDNESISAALSSGTITTEQILGNLQVGSEVSLGTLRTIFGSGTVTLTGKLTKSGYKFNSGSDITIAVTLGALTGGAVVINDGYVTIEKTAPGTATVTILQPAATVGEIMGDSEVDFAAVVAAVVSGTEYGVNQNFKTAIQAFIDSGLFDDLTLSQLVGKTVTFSGYTVIFV